MAIIKNVMVSINKDRAITDSQLYVYRNDHGILYKFTIRDVRYQFSSTTSNLVRELGGVSAIIDVINPQGKVVAQAKQPIVNDTVEFLLTKEMTDEIQDIGTHQLHIHLISANDGMVTLPPFGIEVKDNPICSFNKPNGNEPKPPVDDEKLEELEQAIGDLSKKLTDGLENVAEIAKQIETVSTRVDEAKKLSEANSNSITETNAEVVKAKEDAGKANTLAQEAKDMVSAIESSVTDISDWKTKTIPELETIKSNTDGAVLVATQNAETIKQVVADGKELHTELGNQQKEITNNSDELTKLKSEVASIKRQTDINEAHWTENKQNLNLLGSQMGELTKSFGLLEARVSALESK